MNGISTNLTITINLPSSLKILEFDNNINKSYYDYSFSNFYFRVNYNKLYNSNTSIKFGDISINCKISNDSIHNLYCFHEFPESYRGKTLDLTINNQTTGYSITLKIFPEFSQIINIDEKLYANPFEQYIDVDIDSSKKFEQHSIIFVPLNPNNKNITLSSCTFDNFSFYYEYYNTFREYGNCSAIFNTFEVYNVYIDDVFTGYKFNVFPERNIINLIENIEPKVVNVYSNVIFTLEVDYVANLDKVFITLENQINNEIKINLTNCSQVEGTTNKITCIGNINYSGQYNIYLNNIPQESENAYVSVINNSSLTKALNIYPEIIKFYSSSKIENIEITYNSIKEISKKNYFKRSL